MGGGRGAPSATWVLPNAFFPVSRWLTQAPSKSTMILTESAPFRIRNCVFMGALLVAEGDPFLNESFIAVEKVPSPEHF